MSTESAKLAAIDNRFVDTDSTRLIDRVSSVQLENLLHVQALLAAYLYRYDGDVNQRIDLCTPCLLSTSRRASRTSVITGVSGDMRLVDIKADINESYGNIAFGYVSKELTSDEKLKDHFPGDKLLVFHDTDYSVDDWIEKNSLADITVFCALGEEHMRISFKSRFESIDRNMLDSIGRHFFKFAESAEYEGDEIRIADIDLLTAEDVGLNAMLSPAYEVSSSAGLPHVIFEKLSAESPERRALQFGEYSLDYQTLNKRANQLANFLKNKGIGKGSRCVVLVKPSFDAIVSMLAVFKIGAVYAPIDYEYPPQRITYVIGDSRPEAILCTQETVALVDNSDCKILVDSAELGLSDFPSEDMRTAVSVDDEAYVFYTSGTTGQPKGVVGTYRNLFHYVSVAKKKFGIGTDTIMPVVAKNSFSISFFETLAPLISGGACILLARSDVLDVNRMVGVLRDVTMFHIGPSLLSRIIRKIKQGDPSVKFPKIAHASTGGDMVPVELLHDMSKLFVNAEIYVIYGSSEIACMGCTYLLNRWSLPERTLVGRAFPGMQVKVVDADMNALPPGWKGEICFVGDGVTRGYQNKPELSREKFFEWHGRRGYRTGDIGRVDASGNIEMLGRGDFQVKINGIRVELAEIDYYLKKAPHDAEIISKAAVTEDGDTVIYACVVGELSKLQISETRAYLAKNLPEYMHPKGFIRIDKMPLNHNLKVDRKALPDPTPDNLMRESDYVSAATTTEKSLTGIWEDILGVHPIGVNDDFFASGGTSLQGIDLLVRIEEKLNSTISVNDFMQARTIRSLAKYVDGHEALPEKVESTITLKAGKPGKTIFFIHDGEGDVLPYFSLSQRLGDDWSAFGIAPPADGYARMAYTSFEQMVDFYVSEINKTQPKGPYRLAGLCIGGFLAYCVGCKLQEMGETVSDIILFDSHHIDATLIKGREQSMRSERLMQAIAQGRHHSVIAKTLRTASIIFSKGSRYLQYRAMQRSHAFGRSLQMLLLKHGNKRGWLMKRCAPSVDATIRDAEARYVQRPRFNGDVILFRATRKLNTLDSLHIDDTPYSEIFADEGLGWPGKFDGKLVVFDIAAGHSTLLTPPHVYEIARQMT